MALFCQLTISFFFEVSVSEKCRFIEKMCILITCISRREHHKNLRTSLFPSPPHYRRLKNQKVCRNCKKSRMQCDFETFVSAPLILSHGGVQSFVVGQSEYPGNNDVLPNGISPTVEPDAEDKRGKQRIKDRCLFVAILIRSSMLGMGAPSSCVLVIHKVARLERGCLDHLSSGWWRGPLDPLDPHELLLASLIFAVLSR